MDVAKHAEREAASLRRGKACLFYAGNFVAAVLVLVASSIWSGIYPFGERSFLTEDLMFQYVDFFSWLQRALWGEESLFYSTSQALGGNTWGLYSYYLGSPINLLVAFFERGAVTEFVYFATAVKVGLTQTSIAFFLGRRFGIPGFWGALLGFGFTWSTWTATQLRNPEWLDVLFLLPLAAWGVSQLVRHRHWKTLLFSTALAVICCWYTAYMMIGFLCLYFVLELWMLRNGISVEFAHYGRTPIVQAASVQERRQKTAGIVLLFGRTLLFSLALSAFTFLPTVLAMAQRMSPALDVAVPSDDMVSKAFAFAASHPAVIAAFLGAVGLFVVVVFRITYAKRISERRRLRILAALILVFSAGTAAGLFAIRFSTCDPLSFARGFVSGGWAIDDRVPQLYAGVVVAAMAVSFFLAKGIPSNLKVACLALYAFLLLSVFAGPLYVAWCGFKQPNGFFCRISFLPVFVMVWMAACFVSSRCGVAKERSFTAKACMRAALALFVVLDVLVSVHLAWGQMYQGYPQSFHQGYVSESNAEREDLAAEDPGTYRIAKNYTRAGMAALNEGMAAGYDELSSYSSANDANAVAFLNDLGYSKLGKFSTRYAYPILASDALLGVKYVYSTLGAEGFEAMRGTPNSMGAELYRNPFALSLAYMVDDGAEAVSFAGTEDPFQRQNLLINALVGSEQNPYVRCDATEVEDSGSARTYEVTIPAGCIGYAYVLDGGENPVYLQVDGEEPYMENFRFQDSLYGISGVADEVQLVKVGMHAADKTGQISDGASLADGAGCAFYALEMERFRDIVSTLSERQASFERFGGNRIACDVEVRETAGRILMMTVPNASGWEVRVNGSKVDAVDLVGGALMGIPVDSGANRIEMAFMPPGFVAGCAISGIMVLGLVAPLAARKRVVSRCPRER